MLQKIPFDANCRADIDAGSELLSTLHEAGARLFCVGFESGDIIRQVNGQPVDNVATLKRLLATDQGWAMAIQRGNRTMTLQVN